MRGSSATTFLMFLPLLAIPVLAIFGIPEFRPVNASAPTEASPDGVVVRDFNPGERRSGDNRTGPADRSAARRSAEDLFAPVEDNRSVSSSPVSHRSPVGRGDPFMQGDADDGGDTRSNDNGGNRSNESNDTNDGRDSGLQRRPVRGHGISRHNPGKLQGWQLDRSRIPARQRANRASRNAGRDNSTSAGTSDEAPARRRVAPFPEQTGPQQQDSRHPAQQLDEFVRQRMQREQREFSRAAGNTSAQVRANNTAEERLTWTSAMRRLKQLGITDFLLQPGSGDGAFHFSCTYSRPDNPNITHRFEAEDTDPLQAVAEVLRQIDDRRRMY